MSQRVDDRGNRIRILERLQCWPPSGWAFIAERPCLLETRARCADAYNAESASLTPAPRLAVSICRSPLVTLVSSPALILCPSVDSGQCTAATTAGFFYRGFRRRRSHPEAGPHAAGEPSL